MGKAGSGRPALLESPQARSNLSASARQRSATISPGRGRNCFLQQARARLQNEAHLTAVRQDSLHGSSPETPSTRHAIKNDRPNTMDGAPPRPRPVQYHLRTKSTRAPRRLAEFGRKEPGLGELRAAPTARAYDAAAGSISSIETSKRQRGGGVPSGRASCQYASRRAHSI